jgi:hypothetical protein
MGDSSYAAACGVYCGSCELLGKQCSGCGYVDGSPFWVASVGMTVCPLHDCCRKQKSLEHCGLCDGFPCDVFLGMRDPSWTDEQFQESLDRRRNALRRRTEVGTEQWLSEVPGG